MNGDLNTACTVALAIVEYDRASADLVKAQKVAEKRTGARGSSARKALLVAEARAKQAEDGLSHPQSSEDVVSKTQEMLADIQVALDAVELYLVLHPRDHLISDLLLDWCCRGRVYC